MMSLTLNWIEEKCWMLNVECWNLVEGKEIIYLIIQS